MLTLKNIEYNKTLSFFCFVTLFSSFFLWDLDNKLNPAYVILLPIIFYSIRKPFFLFEKKIIVVNIFFIFLILHFFIFGELKLNEIQQNKILKFIYLYILIIFCANFYQNFIFQIRKLVLIFIYLYLVLILAENILNFENFIISLKKFSLLHFCESFNSSLFRANFLFKENSHLAMINVGICTASLFYISNENSKINKLLIYVYLFISLTNGSTTFYIGLSTSSLIIIFTSYKQLKFNFITKLLIYNILVISVILQIWDFHGVNVCSTRFKHLKATNTAMLDLKENFKNFRSQKGSIKKNKKKIDDFYNFLELRKLELINFHKLMLLLKNENNVEQKQLVREKIKISKNKINYYEKKLIEIDKEKFDLSKKYLYLNLTNQVHFRSYYITLESLKNKLLGWGFDNYEIAFNKYKYDVPVINPIVLDLNTKDASNNFSKTLTEFGLLSLILFAILAIASFSSKVPIIVKLFLMPIIITQFIRGAGYFNGAFIMSIMLFVFIYIAYKNKKFS
tara:strand:- start:12 stop:1538 length:1527 start_codon:yes stop_codon:yes gene_type:complete